MTKPHPYKLFLHKYGRNPTFKILEGVGPSLTVNKLKEMEKIPSSHRLLLDYQKLDGERSLVDENIVNGSHITQVPEGEICITGKRILGNPFDISISPEISVSELIDIFVERCPEFPIKKLFSNGKILEDTQILSDLDFKDGTTVMIIQNLVK